MNEKGNIIPEIALFMEAVEQVLNCNPIYIEYDLPSQNFDVNSYVKELFFTDKFYNSFIKCHDLSDIHSQKSIPDIEIKLLPISFSEFKGILIDMLRVKGIYFSYSPYSVDIGEKTAQYVVDNFIEVVVNEDSAEPYSKNTKQIENTWQFYTMPRDYCNSVDNETAFLENTNPPTYKPMSRINADNFLGNYFSNLGLDCFLVFHNRNRIVFILTNGGD